MMYHTTSKVMVNGKHGHLFFSYHEHIINNIRADPDYRGANASRSVMVTMCGYVRSSDLCV
jgi:hypothetical protein